jgi:hypothetical protein
MKMHGPGNIKEEKSVLKGLYGRTPFMWINCEESHPGMQNILII